MVKITEELLKKRAEHNEGILSTLEEVTLHQYNIEKIEVVGQICRNLKILYLQHNLIEKIENLHHLKRLEYLNIALNSIRKIENLEKNERLTKLDLTINYVDDLLSVESLRANPFLVDLHLVGNPCASYEGYRLFVVGTLPQLKKLDGEDITKSERIEAAQQVDKLKRKLQEIQPKLIERNTEKMLGQKPKFNEQGERLYGNDPVSRKLAAKEMEKQTEKKNEMKMEKKPGSSKRPRSTLLPEEEIEKYGKVMQKNEGRWKFKFLEKNGEYILDVPIGKYCPISQVEIDVQPTYVLVVVRGKRLCLRFQRDVHASKAEAQRSSTTGNLKIRVPIATQVVK